MTTALASSPARSTACWRFVLVTVIFMIAELLSGVTVMSCRATSAALRLILAWLSTVPTRPGSVATALTRLWMAVTWVAASGVVPWPWMVAVAA